MHCSSQKFKKKSVACDRVSEVNVADFLLSFLQQCLSNDRALTFLSKPSESLKLRCLNIFHMYLLSSIFCICKDNVLVYIFLYSVAHLCKNQRCNETMWLPCQVMKSSSFYNANKLIQLYTIRWKLKNKSHIKNF